MLKPQCLVYQILVPDGNLGSGYWHCVPGTAAGVLVVDSTVRGLNRAGDAVMEGKEHVPEPPEIRSEASGVGDPQEGGILYTQGCGPGRKNWRGREQRQC